MPGMTEYGYKSLRLHQASHLDQPGHNWNERIFDLGFHSTKFCQLRTRIGRRFLELHDQIFDHTDFRTGVPGKTEGVITCLK